MEMELIERWKFGFQFVVLLSALLVSNYAVSISASPNPSYDGSFTLGWNTPLGSHFQTQEICYPPIGCQNVSVGFVATFEGAGSPQTAISHSVSGYATGTYTYRIRRDNYFNGSLASTEYEGPVTVIVVRAPGVPSSISAPTTDSDGTLTVYWGSASGSVTKYQAQFKRVDITNGEWTTFYYGPDLHEGTPSLPDGTYKFRVTACKTLSTYTNCNNTYRTTSGDTEVARIPGQPGDISGPSSDDNGIFSLSWNPATGTVNTYKLYRREFPLTEWGSPIQDAKSPRSKTETLTESGVYEYVVSACNVSGCNPEISPSTAPNMSVNVNIPLPKPSPPEWDLAPTRSSDTGDYKISWFPSVTGTVDYYNLEQRINSSDEDDWEEVNLPPSEMKYEVTGGDEGEYNFRLTACNVDNCSDPSLHTIDVHHLLGIEPVVTIEGGDVPGTMSYNTSVSAKGNANINIPVLVYPGVNGLQPNLSIAYSSGRPRHQIDEELPEDYLGYGWSLKGFSAIRRCVKNRTDVSKVQLNSSDSLCLDGEPLVAIAGTYLQPGAEYRTLRESFIKIEQLGTVAEPWFRVTHADGTISEYGYTENARVKVVNATLDTAYFLWSLNSRTDSFGNSIDYNYHKDQLNGINYPLSIDYEGASIGFSYATRDDAAPMPLATVEQGQLVLLHTIEVSFNNVPVREYRIATELAQEGWRRMNQLQECGYDEAGTTPSCLAPLQVDWFSTSEETPDGLVTGVERITDGLGAVTEFDYDTLNINDNFYQILEQPFGGEISIPDTVAASVAPNGATKHVVIEQRRSNGVGGMHRTTYGYQGHGLESTRNWGFLGFYAQRIRNETSGIVTYRQLRQDYPFFGRVSAVAQYDSSFGAHTEQFSLQENRYTMHTNSNGTVFPYLSESTRFIFEQDIATGTDIQLGAEHTVNNYVFDANGFIDSLTTINKVAETVTVSAAGNGFWGDVPTYTLGDVLRSSESDLGFTNRTTAGLWLIGFADSTEVRAYRGDTTPVNLDRTQNAVMSPFQNTNAVETSTRFPGDAEYQLTTTHGYDLYGNRSSTAVAGVNVVGRSSSILTIIEGRYPTTLRNAKDKDTTVEYDLRFGAAKRVTDPNLRVTQVTYDAFGREIQRITPDDVAITTTYEFCNIATCDVVNGITPAFRVQTSSAISPTSTQYLDILGRVIRTEVESFLGTDVIRQDTYYDNLGRVDRYTQPYFSTAVESFTGLSYDLRNRVRFTEHPDGSSTLIDYEVDTFDNVVTLKVEDFLFDSDGFSVGSQIKTSDFNIAGDLVSTTDAVDTIDEITTAFTYDGSGLPLTTTVDDGPITINQYDNAGNRIYLTGPNVGTVETRYTALGELRYQKDNKQQETTFVYDVLGRITERSDDDGTSNWFYDPANAVGALDYRTDNNGFTETHFYNADARLSDIQTDISVPGYSRSYTESYLYDTQGRVDKITYPSGIQVQYGYNAQGYLASLTDIATPTALQTFSDTDAFGNITDEVYGNDIQTQRTFNPLTRRLENISSMLNVATLQDDDYAWRSDGVLESRTSFVGTTKHESFGYDDLNRLEVAKTYLSGNPIRTLDTGYDRLGNIQYKTSDVAGDVDVTDYQYGMTTNAGPHAVSSAIIGGINTTLYYDLNGNVTEYAAASGYNKYITWNARDLPEVVVVGSSAVTTAPTAREDFRYGPDGQRYYKKSTFQASEGQRIEHTFYVGGFEEIVPEVGPDLTQIKKTQVTQTILHVVTDDLVGNIEDGIEYLHRDHLGSVVLITDEAGNELQVMAYDPFGGRRDSDWGSAIDGMEFDDLLENLNIRTSRGYTDHEHLDRTGIIHMNGRVYDPQLGRFLSADPIVQAPGYSQNWNRYSYVWNNPLKYTDPSGYCSSANIDIYQCPDFIAVPFISYSDAAYTELDLSHMGLHAAAQDLARIMDTDWGAGFAADFVNTSVNTFGHIGVEGSFMDEPTNVSNGPNDLVQSPFLPDYGPGIQVAQFGIGKGYDDTDPIVVRNAALQSIRSYINSPDTYYLAGSLVYDRDSDWDNFTEFFGFSKNYSFTYPRSDTLDNKFSLPTAAASPAPASEFKGVEIVIATRRRRPSEGELTDQGIKDLLDNIQSLSNFTQLPVYFRSPYIGGSRIFTPVRPQSE